MVGHWCTGIPGRCSVHATSRSVCGFWTNPPQRMEIAAEHQSYAGLDAWRLTALWGSVVYALKGLSGHPTLYHGLAGLSGTVTSSGTCLQRSSMASSTPGHRCWGAPLLVTPALLWRPYWVMSSRRSMWVKVRLMVSLFVPTGHHSASALAHVQTARRMHLQLAVICSKSQGGRIAVGGAVSPRRSPVRDDLMQRSDGT